MKKALLIAALLISTSAFATGSNNNGDVTNNNDNRNYGGNTNNAGGAGGNGGQGGAGGVGYGGSASASAGAVAGAAAINKNDIKNTNTNQQGQQQGQAQGQSQSVKNSGNSSSSSGVKNSGNSASLSSSNSGGNTQSNAGNNASTSVSVGGDVYEAARIPVATAYAPSIAPTAPCMGSSSGGIQGMSIGVSLGSTWTDANCQLLEQVRVVAVVIGDKETAAEMMVSVPAYAEAKKRIADRKASSASIANIGGGSGDVPAKVSAVDVVSEPFVASLINLPPLAGK